MRHVSVRDVLPELTEVLGALTASQQLLLLKVRAVRLQSSDPLSIQIDFGLPEVPSRVGLGGCTEIVDQDRAQLDHPGEATDQVLQPTVAVLEEPEAPFGQSSPNSAPRSPFAASYVTHENPEEAAAPGTTSSIDSPFTLLDTLLETGAESATPPLGYPALTRIDEVPDSVDAPDSEDHRYNFFDDLDARLARLDESASDT